jgi:hypothetical protein
MNNSIKKHVQKWLQKADRQDKTLSQQKRKVKWISIIGTLFLLYVLSFLQPHIQLAHRQLGMVTSESRDDSLNRDSIQLPVSPFELPVDSFEQLLNQQIKERKTISDENTD